MKNLSQTTEKQQDRLLINNQKCEIALKKGYKYNKETGEIIGKRGNIIKAHINGYTVISFTEKGIKYYLYGTTYIEYILKQEDENISSEELELAKTYVKPSAEFLSKAEMKREALRNKKSKAISADTNYVKLKYEQFKRNPMPAVTFKYIGNNLSYRRYQFGV